MATPPSPAFNVRELLELERQLYQESIERVGRQHEELLRGSLEDFVLRCVPFEDEKGWEIEAAMVQLQLNKRNGLDLLEFELKQAEDVHQTQRQELRQTLLRAAHKRLAKLEKRAKLLDSGDHQVTDAHARDPAALKQRRRSHRKHTHRGSHSPASTEELVVSSRELLAKEVERLQCGNRKAFNLQHLATGIPSAAKIADDVFDELERLEPKQEQFATNASSTEPSTLKVRMDALNQELTIENSASAGDTNSDESRIAATRFRVKDFVILASRLTDEEFFGQISAVEESEVRLVLICGTPARATLGALETGRCSLTHQPPPVHRDGVANCLAAYDERRILDTKQLRLEARLRKKGKRRRMVDIRRGF